jgi:hypothetical protein
VTTSVAGSSGSLATSGTGVSAAGGGAIATAGRAAAASGASSDPAGGSSAAVGGSSASAAGSGTVSGAGGAGGMSQPAAGGACTRENLKAAVDGYFTALAAHDPAMLQQASTVKFTENAKEAKLGEGLVWKSAGAVKFTRSLLDTERCGTVTEAVFPNGGTDTIFGLRLKLVEQKLTEIETIVVDPDSGFFPTPMGILNSKSEEWENVLPADQRSTREQLEAAAKAYFTSFGDTSVKPPYAMPCDRLENGFKTTMGDCSNFGSAGGINQPAQRYPFTDVEAGLTAGFVLFAGADIDFHMFKVVSGKIQRINAVVGPAVRASGWE